jgi:surface protein
MFYGCSGLTSLDLSSFDTSSLKNLFGMFEDCSGLKSINLTNFKTDKVENMGQLFLNCSSLESLDVSGFKTDEANSMFNMFRDCSSLKSLDLSSFNTQKVTNMFLMFSGCSNLTTIFVGSDWSTVSVMQSTEMFEDCTSLVGGSGTKYDANHIDKAYARIDGGVGNPGYFTDMNATINLCPDNNHPHVIDLGLPSGTKWACCNIGASEPYVFGNEYAWGETETKSKYTWETYIYCNGSKETCQDIGTNIAKTEYDVAHVKWGGSYQIPSVDDIKELIDNCTKRSVTYKGIYYTGPNGNTIFVPSRMYGWADETGHHGNYWTSDLSDEPHIAMNWFVWESVYPAKWNNNGRESGFFVRPVAKGNGESPTEETDVDEITIKDIGKTTWCSEYDLDFTNVAGIKAYTATGYDNVDKTIWLTRVMKVPAGTGLLVKGDPNTYKIPHAQVQAYYVNMLVGNLGATISIAATDGDKTNYYLSGKDGSFVSVNGSANIGKNKAYLQLPTSIFAGTRSIGISYDDEDGTTAIRNLTPALSEGEGAWYTLQGQRVAKPGKGLYIRNGKKVVIK